MRGRVLVGLSAEEEGDAGHRRRYASLQQSHGLLRDFLDRSLLRTLLARDRHVGLEDHAFQLDALHPQFLEYLVQDAQGYIVAAIDVVIAVHQDFRLDDRNDLLGLAQRGIARQRVGVDVNGRHGGDTAADIDHRAPFGEARAAFVIFLQPVGELVAAGGDQFAGALRQGLRSLIDLDARDRARLLNQLGRLTCLFTARRVRVADGHKHRMLHNRLIDCRTWSLPVWP